MQLYKKLYVFVKSERVVFFQNVFGLGRRLACRKKEEFLSKYGINCLTIA